MNPSMMMTSSSFSTLAPSATAPLVIEQLTHHVDIKGQYCQLAAPIRLLGQINVSALLTDLATKSTILESNLHKPEQRLIIGVDEAGRGPLLGDVVVAAVILPHRWSGEIDPSADKVLTAASKARLLANTPLAQLTDSKKLSEKKRDRLYPLITEHALGFVIAEIPAAVIDQVNILQAAMIGMRLSAEQLLLSALAGINQQITSDSTFEAASEAAKDIRDLGIDVLFDGNRCPEWDQEGFLAAGLNEDQINLEAWVKGDGRHTSIAAASILAKVWRDAQMYELAKAYPNHGIEQHKGYPTKAHLQAMTEYGVLPMHRRSFAPVRQALASSNQP